MKSFPSSHSACLALPLPSNTTPHSQKDETFHRGFCMVTSPWSCQRGCLHIKQHFWRRDSLGFLHSKEERALRCTPGSRELHPSFRRLGFSLFSGKQPAHPTQTHLSGFHKKSQIPARHLGACKGPAPNVAPVQLCWKMDFPT